jgi:hypothetical protein
MCERLVDLTKNKPRVEWDQRIPSDNLSARNELWIARPFVDIGQALSTTCNARFDRPGNWFDINTIYFAPLKSDTKYNRIDPFRNINVESKLYNLDYYNPADLMIAKDGKCLEIDNSLADRRLYKALQPANINTLKLWGNATSPKMLYDPLTFQNFCY